MDKERSRLKHDAGRTAGELVAEAEDAGDLQEATRWARRALAIDPYDEVAARKLLGLLARAGDRAGAVRVYERFSKRLRDDLDLEASPETVALIRGIRNGEADPGPVTGSSVSGRDRGRASGVGADAGSTGGIDSLAVLPLENLSPGAEEEYFAAGMHDALIGELGQIEALRVISRTSALCFENSDEPVTAIADELNVDAVLEGSVQKVDERVRIQLQLVRAGAEERNVWRGRYDREMQDVLALHSEVARAVAEEISRRLSPPAEKRLARLRRLNPAMYEAYLRGRYHIDTFTPEGFRLGLKYLQQAVEADPADPLPHAALALGYSQYGHESGEPGKFFPRARASALRALEIDDTLAEAHEALAETKLYWEWDWRGAGQAFDRALEINPNLALGHAHRAWYLHLRRRWDEGVAEMRRAGELDPLVPLFPAWEGWQLRLVGRLDEAIDRARTSLELQNDFPVGLYVLGDVHAARGLYDEALEYHRRAAEVSPGWAWGLGHACALAGRRDEARRVATRLKEEPTAMTPFGLAVIHAALGESEEAFRWLKEAFETRFSWVPWIAVYEPFALLRELPGFPELERQLRLPAGGSGSSASRRPP